MMAPAPMQQSSPLRPRPALRLVGLPAPPPDLRATILAETMLIRAEARCRDRVLLLLSHAPGPDLSPAASALVRAGRARGLDLTALARPDQAAAARAAGLALTLAGRFDLILDPLGGAEVPLALLAPLGIFVHPGLGLGRSHPCDPRALGFAFPREVFAGFITLSSLADLTGDRA